MVSEENLLPLIGRIYDAAADESLWSAFLEAFANTVDGATTALVYHDLRTLRVGFAISVRSDPECIRLYTNHYGAFDPLRSAWLARFSRAAPEGVVTSEQMIDPGQFQKSEYYNDFLLPNRIVHSFCGPITVDSRWSSVLTCLRSQAKGSFGPEAVTLLRALLPHLQRALQFHGKMSELQGQYRASLDAMDRLATGVIFLDECGRITNMNRAARRALDQNDGLRAEKEGLVASSKEQTYRLRSMIRSCALTLKRGGFSAGGEIGIVRPSGKRPFAVLITPVSSTAFPPDASRPAAIAFVNDPDTKTGTTSEALANLYHLTHAESRLAELLMNGETLVGAAELLGISHNTARTHLHRIYEKTDTRHQGALVRLLSCGASRLARD